MLRLISIFSFLTLSNLCVAQSDVEADLEMNKSEFAVLVDSISTRILDGDTSFTEAESITLVRIYNTIEFNGEMRYEHGGFLVLFNCTYMNWRCAETLKMSGLNFGNFYSKELDLFLGYKDHANSRFKIIDSE